MRHTFGQSLTDWTMSISESGQVLVAGAVTVTFWSQEIGGVQYTDLLDGAGAAVSTIVSSNGTDGRPAGTIPEFQGPDGITEMWADGGGGTRFKMIATDIGDLAATVDANAASISDLQATVSELAPVATSGAYIDLTGAPMFAPVATSGAYGDLTGRPALGIQYVVKSGSWPLRSVSAPDSGRPAMWIGPAPAPPATAGYAIEGDLFMATS